MSKRVFGKKLYTVTRFYPNSNYIWKGKGAFGIENSGRKYLNQMLKFNVTSNGTNWYCEPRIWFAKKDPLNLHRIPFKNLHLIMKKQSNESKQRDNL